MRRGDGPGEPAERARRIQPRAGRRLPRAGARRLPRDRRRGQRPGALDAHRAAAARKAISPAGAKLAAAGLPSTSAAGRARPGDRAQRRPRSYPTARCWNSASAPCPTPCCALLGRREGLRVHSGSVGDGVVELAQRRRGQPHRRRAADRLAGGCSTSRATTRACGCTAPTTRTAPTCSRKQQRFVAINSAVEVDLTGQVNGEVADGSYVGAVGGALDFIRAANASPGGVSIVLLPANASSSGSRVRSPLRAARPASSSPSAAPPTCAAARCASASGACARSAEVPEVAHHPERRRGERDEHQRDPDRQAGSRR